jgi:hypothetical protein
MTVRLLSLFLVMCMATIPAAGETRSANASVASGIDQDACDRMKTRGVLAPDAPVSCEKLAIVRFSYIDFEGRIKRNGEIMVMAAVADFVATIFDALYQRRFPIARAVLMDHYFGDDPASMKDNNTSAFNHRPVTGGKLPSLHAYGLAIDLNPVQNPFMRLQPDGTAFFSPANGIEYANRLNQRPGKARRSGMAEDVIELFANNGFLVWGGDWDAPIDYQHFQVERKMAERMAALPIEQAHALFSNHVRRYRACLKNRGTLHKSESVTRVACIENHQ